MMTVAQKQRTSMKREELVNKVLEFKSVITEVKNS